MLYISIGLLMICLCQCIFNYYRIVKVSLNLITLVGGFIMGVVQLYYEDVNKVLTLTDFPPKDFVTLYVPVRVFTTAFCVDSASFRKCLFPILITSIPIALLTGLVAGTVSLFILDEEWSMELGILFGILCCPTHPRFVVRLVRTIATKTKSVDLLLDGEAMITTALMTTMNTTIMLYMSGWLSRWHHFIAMYVRVIGIGLSVGYVCGKIGRFAIRHVYEDVFSVVSIISCIPMISFSLGQRYLYGDGVIAVIVTGLIMNKERPMLSKKMDERLTDTWKVMALVMEFAVCSYISITVVHCAASSVAWHHYVITLVIYSLYYTVRFCCFALFFPLLKRSEFGIDFYNTFLCVWGGTKNALSLLVITNDYHYKDLPDGVAQIMYFHVTCLFFLSYLINATLSSVLLKYLGLTEISTSRQINMNNCMKHIFTKRERVIAMLKMDRFLGDTNWAIVHSATNMQHPFKTKLDPECEQAEFFLGYRYTTCPDCKKELVAQPTAKELIEMKREAQIRILKTKKISYARQYESGMVSKEGVKTLTQAVEIAVESNNVAMDIESLHKKLHKEGLFSRFIKKQARKMMEESYKINVIRSPRSYYRRLCYLIVTNKKFEYYMYGVVILNMIPIIIECKYHNAVYQKSMQELILFYILTAINTLFFIIYLTEFIMKVLGYSSINIKQGFGIYFSSKWNILDFFILCGATVDIIVQYIRVAATMSEEMNITLWKTSLAMEVIRLLRALRLLRFCASFYPMVIRYLDREANARMTVVYELGKTYVAGEAEILNLLPYLIDHIGIREELKRTIEEDRVAITKLLGLVQKDRPWIAITVKTKQAIRTILSSMKEAINQLKVLGWANDFEHMLLKKELGSLYREVNAIKTVDPSAPKVIFKEVPWMSQDEKTINFLFEHVTVKKFEPDDIVMTEGSVSQGIYIVVAGLLKLSYTPESTALNQLEDLGRLPIVDLISSNQYYETVIDYIVSGNCLGELSTLTDRPYNCTITAVTHTQVYVLSNVDIKQAMELSPDPINGLECRIWKSESIRIAMPILLTIPTYHSLRQDQIKYTLQRAFVPNLADFKIFAVTTMIQDIILIEGVVADYNTKEILTAPCYIPRTVQKLILPTSSLMNIPVAVETKLLIIPELNVDAVDVMLMAEEMCEVVATRSHSQNLQNRAWRLNKLKESLKSKHKRRLSNESEKTLVSTATEKTVN